MSVFFTDSNCELWWEKQEKLNIQYISMPYTLKDKEYYYDLGKNTDFKAFFSEVKRGELPITSALSPQNYVDIFTPYLENGQDILYVHFSSNLSGTFSFLEQAIKELKVRFPHQNIRHVDTLSITLGAGILVYEAAIMHKRGCTDEEIIKFVEKEREHYATYFTVDDLKHLVRGGRLSSTSAFFGGLLNIKPILRVSPEGKIEAVRKVTGRKKSILELIQIVKELGSNVADHPIGILHADAEEEAVFLKEKIVELVGSDAEIWLQQVGPTIGSHCGQGTLAIVFHAKNR